MEKSARFDLVYQLGAFVQEFRDRAPADRRARGAGRGSEGGEVPLAQEVSGRAVESPTVEGVRVMKSVAAAERQRNLGPIEVVAVRFRPGVEAGMEIIVRYRGFENPDVIGQHRVHPVEDPLRRDRPGENEMDDLGEGMNSAVRSSRRRHPDGLLRHLRERRLEPGLDGVLARLQLKPPIRGPVVGENRLQLGHGLYSSESRPRARLALALPEVEWSAPELRSMDFVDRSYEVRALFQTKRMT